MAGDKDCYPCGAIIGAQGFVIQGALRAFLMGCDIAVEDFSFSALRAGVEETAF